MISKLCRTSKSLYVVLSVLILLLLIPLISMFLPGKITHSRFGLTVVGFIPVPVLDVTVSEHGVLWFRDKSHFISVEEIEPLLSPDVEIIILGIGWQKAVEVDEKIREIKNAEVIIEPTPEAYRIFNESKSEGKKVILIAHSTC